MISASWRPRPQRSNPAPRYRDADRGLKHATAQGFNERIEQKIFHCEIVVDAEKVKREESAYKKIPVITNFTDEDGNDRMKETVQANYRRIKEEVKQIVQEELERIANDDNLKHLLQQK